MKIYFAGSIRGGRSDALIYEKIIKVLQNYGEVLTEHVGNSTLLNKEDSLNDQQIHDRDVAWIDESNVMVAEVTQPSLGVGYELALAMQKGKKVLCLFNNGKNGRLSAMVSGQPYYDIKYYKEFSEVESILKHYFLNKNVVD